MLERLINWMEERFSSADRESEDSLRDFVTHPAPKPPEPAVEPAAEAQPDFVDVDPHLAGHIEEAGPGKNVLIRNKYVREETGTHETLTILDDSMVDSGEETGIDPYNTGGFDRSRNWDKRFRN